MTVTYTTAVKNARMTAVRDQIDSGGAAGRLEILTAGSVVLATVPLGYSGVSTGTIAAAALTLAGFPRSDAAADSGGTAALARIRTSAGTDVITGLTVGIGTGDVQLDTLTIAINQVVTINSAVITHAA